MNDRFEEKDYNKPFSLKTWLTMVPFFKPYLKVFITAVSLIIFSSIVDIVLPLFGQYAINNFIRGATLDGLFPFVLLYLLVIAMHTAGVVVFTRMSMFLDVNVSKDLRRATFLKLQTLSFSYYNTTPVGFIIARVMSDANRIAGVIAWGLIDMFWAFSYVIGVFIAMFLLNVQLALMVVTVVPAIALLTLYFQGKILRLNRRNRRINSLITGAYNEGITGVKTTKTLVVEKKSHEQFTELTKSHFETFLSSAKLNGIYIPSIVFFGALASAFVLSRGGQFVMDDLMLIGTLSVFTTYAVGIFEPIQQLARNIAELISAQANIERVEELLAETPNVVDSPEVVEKYGDSFFPKKDNWEPIKGDIEFKDVTFKYPDGKDYVLENFSLKIPAGTTVAIVGETGAGKSTLVNLACRFFEPVSGQILIDGIDYKERSQLWLHSNIGYVLQAPHLFSGTIADNIRYGKLDATMDEIDWAAKCVSANTVVERLEEGYNSDVGEGGDRLSTGEKQLISFARAVIADPRIFVLDEATSSIDTHTEMLIQGAISHILKDRTSFLIAHRLSTIRQADMILVVHAGKIVEQGTHEELLKQRGHYHGLYTRQFQEEAALSYFKGDKEGA